MGEQTRKSYTAVKSQNNFQPRGNIYTDVYGPINVEAPRASCNYFLLKANTSFRKIQFLMHESEVCEKVEDFENFVTTQRGNKLGVLKPDKQHVYTSVEEIMLSFG